MGRGFASSVTEAVTDVTEAAVQGRCARSIRRTSAGCFWHTSSALSQRCPTLAPPPHLCT